MFEKERFGHIFLGSTLINPCTVKIKVMRLVFHDPSIEQSQRNYFFGHLSIFHALNMCTVWPKFIKLLC